jgi:hypothetical protein
MSGARTTAVVQKELEAKITEKGQCKGTVPESLSTEIEKLRTELEELEQAEPAEQTDDANKNVDY